MKQWEYKLAHALGLHDIEELGLQGWELCGIRTETHTLGPSTWFYFKRELVVLPLAIQKRSN